MSGSREIAEIDLTNTFMCWEITLTNGKVIRLTSHEEDVRLKDAHYLAASNAASGLVASYATKEEGLSPDAVELTLNFAHPAISEVEVLRGDYDQARVRILLAGSAVPAAEGVTLQHGFIGHLKLGNGYFTAQILDRSALLASHFITHYSAQCRANFCDAKCGLNSTNYTVKGTITKRVDEMTLIDEKLHCTDGRYSGGILTMVTGLSKGRKIAVRSVYESNIVLALMDNYAIEIGDQYELTAGCDKRLQTCVSVYNNALNFRGEPHLPGNLASIIT